KKSLTFRLARTELQRYKAAPLPGYATFSLPPRSLGLIDNAALRYLFSLALTLFLACSVTSQAGAGVMQSMDHSDGFFDFASGMVQAEVPDKDPRELRSTPGVDIVIGHARKDQSGAILVSGLARRRFGSDCGPNMKVEVVVRGPGRRVLEEA